MSQEREQHNPGMPPGFPELWESVTRARMDIAELKGIYYMLLKNCLHMMRMLPIVDRLKMLM